MPARDGFPNTNRREAESVYRSPVRSETATSYWRQYSMCLAGLVLVNVILLLFVLMQASCGARHNVYSKA